MCISVFPDFYFIVTAALNGCVAHHLIREPSCSQVCPVGHVGAYVCVAAVGNGYVAVRVFIEYGLCLLGRG